MEGDDGAVDVIRQLWLFSDAYNMMLPGRAEELNILMGLEPGAGDYITQPRPGELPSISSMMRYPCASEESLPSISESTSTAALARRLKHAGNADTWRRSTVGH